MALNRDRNGILIGDIEYDSGFPATVLSHIAPIVYPCASCSTMTFHVAVTQPHGYGIKLPFMKKPLATTSKEYGIICNDCGTTSGISGKHIVEKLERRIVPYEICVVINRYFEANPNTPKAYSDGFVAFCLSMSENPNDFLSTCLSIYRAE